MIEKVSFYKAGSSPFRSGDTVTPGRVMMISLPRLKCLESDGEEYRPRWAVDYTPPVILTEEQVADQKARRGPFRQVNKTLFRGASFSAFERKVWDLRETGLSPDEIVERLNSTRSSVKHALRRARAKLGLTPVD